MRKIPDLGFYLEPFENLNPDTPYPYRDTNPRGGMAHSDKTENGELGPLIYNSPTYTMDDLDLSDRDYTIELKLETYAYFELMRVNESGNKDDGYNYDGLRIWYSSGYLWVGRIGYPGAQYFRKWKIYADKEERPEYTNIVVVRRAGDFTFYVNGESRFELKDIKHSPEQPYFITATSNNAKVILFTVTIDIALPPEAHWNYDSNKFSNKPLANSHLVYKAKSGELTIDDVSGRYLMDIYSSGSWLIAVFTNRERVAFLRPRGLDTGKVIETVDFFENKLRLILDDATELVVDSIIPVNSVNIDYPNGFGVLKSDGSRHALLRGGDGVLVKQAGSLTVIKSKAVKSTFATEANCVIFEEVINCEDNMLRPYFNVVDRWLPIPESDLSKRASGSNYFMDKGKMFVPAGSYIVELTQNLPYNFAAGVNGVHVGVRINNKTLNETIMRHVSKLDDSKNIVSINDAVEVYLPIDSEIGIDVYASQSLTNMVLDTVINSRAVPLKLAFKRI